MRTVILILFMGFYVPFFSQGFIGEISGKISQLDFESDFLWCFKKDSTIYKLNFLLEREEHQVVIIFDGDSTALIQMYEGGKLVESNDRSPSQISSSVIVLEENKKEGVEIIGYPTETYVIRTEENVIEANLGSITVDWQGADYFFAGDIPFALVSLARDNFPLKIVSKDLQGNIDYSMEVTSVVKK